MRNVNKITPHLSRSNMYSTVDTDGVLDRNQAVANRDENVDFSIGYTMAVCSGKVSRLLLYRWPLGDTGTRSDTWNETGRYVDPLRSPASSAG